MDDDATLFVAVREKLFVAVVGDVLDGMGLRAQFLPPQLKPIDPAMVLLGRAMPVLEVDLTDPDEPPFGAMFRALDDLRPGELYVAGGTPGAYALWGGLMSVRAQLCGAAGAVLHGYHRDTAEILRLGFPVASFGGYAQDQAPRGRVADFRIPVTLGSIRVAPGDIVYGDRDGVLVVPQAAAAEAFARAFEKVRGENQVLQALRSGMSSAEAFATFGLM